jgi:GNAT superfamily N-acetyltransferase
MEPAWRGVSAEDAEGLFELDRAVKRTDGPETVSDLVEDALAADVAVCASARDGAIIGVGFVKGTTLGGTVHPDYRRRGVGTHLLGWAEEHAPGDGTVGSVPLWSRDGNVATNCTYEHCNNRGIGTTNAQVWTEGQFHACLGALGINYCQYKYPQITIYYNGSGGASASTSC